MGWIKSVASALGYVKATPGQASEGWVDVGDDTAGRTHVDYTQAYLEDPHVYTAVDLISTSVSQLPLLVMKDSKKDDSKPGEPVKSHPFYELLSKPNPVDTEGDILEKATANLLLSGNIYGYLGGEGKPEGIRILSSHKVKPEMKRLDPGTKLEKPEDMIAAYKYGATESFIPAHIVTGHTYNPDSEFTGLSPVCPLADTVDTTTNARKSNLKMFLNGMRLQHVFKSAKPRPQDALVKRMLDNYTSRQATTANAHKPMFLWDGMEVDKDGLSPREMDYLGGMRQGRMEISGVFRVPLILLGDMESATYNNIREAMRILYTLAIMPRLPKLEEFFTRILQRFPGSEELYCQFDLSNVSALKEDLRNRAEIHEILTRSGVPYNESKKLLELPLEDQPDGDVGLYPFSLSPMGGSASAAPLPEGAALPTKTVHKRWTDEQKAAKWKAFDRIATAGERAEIPDLRKFFAEQKQHVISALNATKGISLVKDGGVGAYISQGKAVNLSSVVGVDSTEEKTRLYATILPHLRDTLILSARHETALLQGKAAPDATTKAVNETNPRVAQWLRRYGVKQADDISETTKQLLRDQLADGIEAGEAIPLLVERVEKVYKFCDEVRAERIARTENIAAANQGALESYVDGGVEWKGWLSAMDDDTRYTHINLGQKYGSDDTAIPVDADFESESGATGQAPGQFGDPAEDCNCRCTIFPSIRER